MKLKNLRRFLSASLLVPVLCVGSVSLACSIFRMPLTSSIVVGRNFDWDFGHGLMVVNKRGVAKAVLPNHPSDTVQWVSKYGSLTFNQAGRELPYGGVNEKGLMIEVLWLGWTAWPVSAAPSINETQWIQYQLDTQGSVADLVAHIDDVRILSVFAKVHFFACDQTGACATIEGLSSKYEIHTGADLPLPALTNNPYGSSNTFAQKYLQAGTCSAISKTSTTSLDRFARASCEISKSPTASVSEEISRADSILDAVSQPHYTKWQIVYDLSQRTISIRTADAPLAKFVSLDAFDLSCSKPAQILDLNTVVSVAGTNVSTLFTDYAVDANRKIVEKSLINGFANLPQAQVDQIVAYPDMTKCVAP